MRLFLRPKDNFYVPEKFSTFWNNLSKEAQDKLRTESRKNKASMAKEEEKMDPEELSNYYLLDHEREAILAKIAKIERSRRIRERVRRKSMVAKEEEEKSKANKVIPSNLIFNSTKLITIKVSTLRRDEKEEADNFWLALTRQEVERTGELQEDHQNRELEAIINKEWEKALSRQNQQNLNRDSKDKLENWEAEPSNTAFTWGAGWTEVTRDKTSKVIKVGKSYNIYNLIFYTFRQ